MNLAATPLATEDTEMISGMAFVVSMSIVTLGLLIALLWFLLNIIRTKTASTQQTQYRTLAENVHAELKTTNDNLTALTTELTEVRARLTTVERIMRDVE